VTGVQTCALPISDGVTSITATAPLTGGTITSTGSIGLDQTALSITRSQVSDFTSGTVAQAGTATYATTSGTAVFSTNSGTATYATTSGTSVNISGTVTQSQVTNLVSDLALKAPSASPTFSGTVTLPFASSGLLQVDSAGSILKTDAAPGLGYIPYTASTTGNYAWQLLSTLAKTNVANAFTVGGHSITSEGTAVVPLVLKGASGQTGFLTEWQNSGGTVLASISNVGHVRTTSLRFSANNGTLEDANGVSPYVVFTTGNIRFDARTSTFIPLVVRGVASQSANLQEWQNSGGTALAKIDSGGGIFGPNGAKLGLDTFSGVAYNGISNPSGVTTIPSLVVKANPSQTSNLQEWHNSAGTVRARVNSDGVVFGNTIAGINNLVFLRELNSGGLMEMRKADSAVANPGANSGRLYFRDGTNAGTLKLVVRAGAAGAETTILDNIPQ
jgi:hypothetical protein